VPSSASYAYVLLSLEKLFLALLVHLVLKFAQAGDDLPSLVTKEPSHIAELDSIALAVLGCKHKK
jgi:hypothetical protein